MPVPFSFTQQEMEAVLRSRGYKVYYFDYKDVDDRTGESDMVKLTLATRAFTYSEMETIVKESTKYQLLERFGVRNIFYSDLKTVLLDFMTARD